MTALQLLINNCFITVRSCSLLTIMGFAGVFLIIWHFSSLIESRCSLTRPCSPAGARLSPSACSSPCAPSSAAPGKRLNRPGEAPPAPGGTKTLHAWAELSHIPITHLVLVPRSVWEQRHRERCWELPGALSRYVPMAGSAQRGRAHGHTTAIPMAMAALTLPLGCVPAW